MYTVFVPSMLTVPSFTYFFRTLQFMGYLLKMCGVSNMHCFSRHSKKSILHSMLNEVSMFPFNVCQIDNFTSSHVFIAGYKCCVEIIIVWEKMGIFFSQTAPLLPP